jgi:hypothetical protein
MCPVESLNPITDPLAKEFEEQNGDVVDYTGLSATMANALQCLEQHSGQGRSQFVTSAYRPREYQAHLWEVAKKRAQLNRPENLSNPACEPMRAEVNAEFDKHDLISPQDPKEVAPVCDPARAACPHVRGDAIDVGSGFIPTVDQLAGTCAVFRPYPAGYVNPRTGKRKEDPVHVQPR